MTVMQARQFRLMGWAATCAVLSLGLSTWASTADGEHPLDSPSTTSPGTTRNSFIDVMSRATN